MKWAISLFCCLNLAAAAELTGSHTVFIMTMSHGLDQYIANRLTRMHVLQVVTDPAKADTVICDQVGSQLEDRLKDLYPPPPPPEDKKAAEKHAAEKDAASEQADKPDAAHAPSFLADTVNQADKPGSMSLGGRGHGTVFLVDVKSRAVLWSAFERPKNSAPQELDRTAERIVKLLKVDLEGQKAK